MRTSGALKEVAVFMMPQEKDQEQMMEWQLSFFQQSWSIIKRDVVNMIKIFLERIILMSVSITDICLILKTAKPNCMAKITTN